VLDRQKLRRQVAGVCWYEILIDSRLTRRSARELFRNTPKHLGSTGLNSIAHSHQNNARGLNATADHLTLDNQILCWLANELRQHVIDRAGRICLSFHSL
jgi:hypothetical protein